MREDLVIWVLILPIVSIVVSLIAIRLKNKNLTTDILWGTVIISFVCALAIFFKEDLVSSKVCKIFLNGRIKIEKGFDEYDGEGGGGTYKNYSFSPSSRSDENYIALINAALLIGAFTCVYTNGVLLNKYIKLTKKDGKEKHSYTYRA